MSASNRKCSPLSEKTVEKPVAGPLGKRRGVRILPIHPMKKTRSFKGKRGGNPLGRDLDKSPKAKLTLMWFVKMIQLRGHNKVTKNFKKHMGELSPPQWREFLGYVTRAAKKHNPALEDDYGFAEDAGGNFYWTSGPPAPLPHLPGNLG